MKVYISIVLLGGLVALALSCNPLDAKDCLTGYSVTDISSLCKFTENGKNITECINQKTDCIPSQIPEWDTLQGAAEAAGLLGSCNAGVNLQPVLVILLPSIIMVIYRWIAS